MTRAKNGLTRARVRGTFSSRYECGACERPSPTLDPPDYCVCGAERFWVPTADGAVDPTPANTAPIRTWPCPGYEELFPDGFPAQGQVWSGEPGSGKSRFAMLLCTSVGNTAYLSLEMAPKLAFAMAQSCGVPMERIRFWDNPRQFLAASPRGFRSLIVDSAQEVPRSLWSPLFEHAARADCALLWINQINAQGKRRGGPRLAHRVDIEFWLRKGPVPGTCAVEVRKHRLQLPPAAPVIFALARK